MNYSSLINKIQAPVVVHGNDTRMIAINPKAQELLGITEVQILGMEVVDPYWKFLDANGEILPEQQYPVNQVLTTHKELRDNTLGICRPDTDDIIWVSVSADPVFDDNGEIERVIVTFMDITERRLIEKNLEKKEETARALLNASTESAFLIETDGTFVEMNEVTAARLGKRVEDLLGTSSLDLLPPELAATRNKIIDEVMQKRQPIRIEDERSGIILDSNVYPVLDSKGEVSRIAIFSRDITKRKRAERALRESEKKYQDLYDNAPDMFVSVDAKSGAILQCNQTLTRNLGYTKEEIIGRPIFDLYSPDIADHAKSEVFPLFLKTGKIEGEELQLQRKDGGIMNVSLNVSAVRDENGNIVQGRSVLRDITKRKQVEKEREGLIEDLQKALKEIKTLRGILPLCSYCKKVRNDRGYWEKVDVYINKYSQADVSHSICPECFEQHYPGLDMVDE